MVHWIFFKHLQKIISSSDQKNTSWTRTWWRQSWQASNPPSLMAQQEQHPPLSSWPFTKSNPCRQAVTFARNSASAWIPTGGWLERWVNTSTAQRCDHDYEELSARGKGETGLSDARAGRKKQKKILITSISSMRTKEDCQSRNESKQKKLQMQI